ncbi:MAG TPA: hypothetical protein VKY74_02850 [Chloroflexia bacterium]|nr:hypothetical protein [Chloroflexia bacterium]
MNCEILNTLYVRSNGDIPCDDDAGEQIILGHATPNVPDWNIAALLANPRYTHIRAALQRGEPPWPATCPSCAFFRPNEPYADAFSRQQIRKIQVEPSLACRLRCPACSNAIQVQSRPRPFRMALSVFAGVLRSLHETGFTVGEIEYCGQGEPLLHPEFPQFVRQARGYFPQTRQRLITSGNATYLAATGGERLDEIFVSCDGARQSSYEQYRIGGQIDRVIQFMRDIPKQVNGQPQALIWKYILFTFNDSDEEIHVAQNLAQEIGVHTMLFVFTHSPQRSRRYIPENAADFPLYFPNVVTNATPIHYQQAGSPVSRDRSLCFVDEITQTEGGLMIRGWALAHDRLTAIRVSVDGRLVGEATLGHPRPDVLAAHPEFAQGESGFLFQGAPGPALMGAHVIGLSLLVGDTVIQLWHRTYELGG